MSIFSEIARLIISEKLKAIHDASEEADKSFATSLRAVLSAVIEPILATDLKRSLVLSAEKRQEVINLGEEIQLSIQRGVEDFELIKALKKSIEACRQKVQLLTTAKDKRSGETETCLDLLVVVLQSTFDRLNHLELLDTPYDATPLNSIRYAIGLYFALQSSHEKDKSYLEHAADMIRTSRETFAEQQIKILVAALTKCNALTAALVTEPALFQSTVIDLIKGLIYDNNKLDIKYNQHFLSGAGSVGTDSVLFEQCFQGAIEEISSLSTASTVIEEDAAQAPGVTTPVDNLPLPSAPPASVYDDSSPLADWRTPAESTTDQPAAFFGASVIAPSISTANQVATDGVYPSLATFDK